MSATYRERPRRRRVHEPEPAPQEPGVMRWRTLFAIVAAFLTTVGLLQFIWAAHEAGLGGADGAVGAANEANGLRTGLSGLVLLALIVLLSSATVRRAIRAVWVRIVSL